MFSTFIAHKWSFVQMNHIYVLRQACVRCVTFFTFVAMEFFDSCVSLLVSQKLTLAVKRFSTMFTINSFRFMSLQFFCAYRSIFNLMLHHVFDQLRPSTQDLFTFFTFVKLLSIVVSNFVLIQSCHVVKLFTAGLAICFT